MTTPVMFYSTTFATSADSTTITTGTTTSADPASPPPRGSKRDACSCCEYGAEPGKKRRGRPQKCPTRFFWELVEANGGVVARKEVRRGRPPVPLPSVEEIRASLNYRCGPLKTRQQQQHHHHHQQLEKRLYDVESDACGQLPQRRTGRVETVEYDPLFSTPSPRPEDFLELNYSTDDPSEPSQQQHGRRTRRPGSDPDCVEFVDLTADEDNNHVELNPSSVLRLLSEESTMLFSPEIPDSLRRVSTEAQVARILLNLSSSFSSSSSSEEERVEKEDSGRQVLYSQEIY